MTKARERLAVAAVAVMLVAACAPASPSINPINSAPPSTSAVTPSVAASAALGVQPLPAAGVLAPGRYRLGEPFPVPFDVTFVGDKWDTFAADDCCVMVEQSFHQPPGLLFFAAWTVDEVYADPCKHVSTGPIGAGVDDLVAAFRAVPAYVATEPVRVVVGGMTGKRMSLAYPDDLDAAACTNAEFWVWGFRGENTRYVPPGYPDSADELWILDAGGTRIVIDGILSEGTDADRATLERMVESIEFDEADPAP